MTQIIDTEAEVDNPTQIPEVIRPLGTAAGEIGHSRSSHELPMAIVTGRRTMADELEPGPDPRKIRNPHSRRPDKPVRVDDALRSYRESKPFSIRRPTEGEAFTVWSEIKAAVYYLNRWECYDLRVRPYVTEHYKIGHVEYTFAKRTRKAPEGWSAYDGGEFHSPAEFSAMHFEATRRGARIEHYYKTNFVVRDPMARGFRQMSKGQLEEAHQRSADVRGVEIKPSQQRRRTVQVRANG